MLREQRTDTASLRAFKRIAQLALLGIALAGLTSCGGGGGGGSSTPPETTPTPTPTPTPDPTPDPTSDPDPQDPPPEIPITPTPTSISWTITDQCNDDRDMEFRFFQYSADGTPSLVWPGEDEVYVTSGLGEAGVSNLACTSGQRVCYGARARGNTSWRWGVGLDGDEGCDKCCATCPSSGTSSQSHSLTCSASAPGADPEADPLDDVNVTLPASCPLQICVRDHECEDGDEIRVSVNGSRVFEGELFSDPHCFTVPVTAGTNAVRLLALNGTGYKGKCNHGDGNTGEIRIHGQAQTWQHRGGAGSSANINVTIGPAPADGSCTPGSSSPPAGSSPPSAQEDWGAAGIWTVGASKWGLALVGGHPSESSALSAVRATCARQGGTACSSRGRPLRNACAAIAVSDCNEGCNRPSFALRGSNTSQEAEANAIRACQSLVAGTANPAAFGQCRVATTDDGNAAVQCVGTAR